MTRRPRRTGRSEAPGTGHEATSGAWRRPVRRIPRLRRCKCSLATQWERARQAEPGAPGWAPGRAGGRGAFADASAARRAPRRAARAVLRLVAAKSPPSPPRGRPRAGVSTGSPTTSRPVRCCAGVRPPERALAGAHRARGGAWPPRAGGPRPSRRRSTVATPCWAACAPGGRRRRRVLPRARDPASEHLAAGRRLAGRVGDPLRARRASLGRPRGRRASSSRCCAPPARLLATRPPAVASGAAR
jgi:hypothetical protein